MAKCDVCGKSFRMGGLTSRLAIPEYRSMIGVWSWVDVRVCESCLAGYDRDFLERLRLLAPDVVQNDEPITKQVCLVCGATDGPGEWREASKWVDAAGRPVRRCRFHLCHEHADAAYVDGVIVTTNVTGAMGDVLDELPVAAGDLVERIEGWRPGAGTGPEGASDLREGLSKGEAEAALRAFWDARPADLEARAAWLGPVRRDYRMKYRLDAVRDYSDGRREALTVLRTAPEAFALYRTTAAR